MKLRLLSWLTTTLVLIGCVGLSASPTPLLSESLTSQTLPTAPPSMIDEQTPSQPSADALCPLLPPPSGSTTTVSNVSQLEAAVNAASSGTTILVNDGTYNLDGVYLRFDTPNVTLRSASGNRENVILDGNYATTEIIQIVASNVTIADLTLREAYDHPIHVMSTDTADTDGTLIYNVHIIDPGQQAIKINPHTMNNASYFTDAGVIACSHIELTDAGRSQIRDDCYTGGIDAHQSRDWIIRDNLIEGFWCATGLSEHAIHVWRASRDTLVERNDLRNNARGIGFGMMSDVDYMRTYSDNPCPSASGSYIGHYGGIIRNNFVFANRGDLFTSEYGFDCGICLSQACGTQAVHNTVVSTQAPFSSIEWYLSRTNVEIRNNLVSHNLRDRGGTAALAGNLEEAPLSLFVDGSNGDLHLDSGATTAIDQAASLTAGLCDDDFDGDARPVGSTADVGADEYGAGPPSAVSDLRLTRVTTGTGTLTTTLRWTHPTSAITTELRYAYTPIVEGSWAGSTLLTDTLLGETGIFTAAIPYGGGTVYAALKSRNAFGTSALSNNGFWPAVYAYLPATMRQ